jgi:DNA primase catalytic subunit
VAKVKQPVLNEGWEVEWCVSVPMNEFGEADHDSADRRFQDFKTEGEARAFAVKVLPSDWYGGVRLTPFYTEPYNDGYPGGSREYSADAEYIEKE